ncbi:hypothetical protein WA538_005860, partial [Blastocystis sp. DL]
MQEMGLNTERDILYDPSLDDRYEEWSNQHHERKKTDAILCCPSCFTTICYECREVTKGLLSNVQRDYEKSGSHTFVTRKVYNCYVVGVRPIQATVTEGDKSQSLSLGHPIICSVCGNEVGFKKGNLYYLMNMIEEDGDID